MSSNEVARKKEKKVWIMRRVGGKMKFENGEKCPQNDKESLMKHSNDRVIAKRLDKNLAKDKEESCNQ